MPNDEDPGQSGGDAQEATIDNNANPSREPGAPATNYGEFTGVQAVQTSNAEPLPETSPVDSKSFQGQQAQNPPGHVGPGETFPIPSVIGINDNLKNRPYELLEYERDFIESSDDPNGDPYLELISYDTKMKIRIQQGQNSPNKSKSGETHPIQSIMATGPDPSDADPRDGPYDPHQEQLFAAMITKLSRNEAKDLRERFREIGLDHFFTPFWRREKRRGWKFTPFGGQSSKSSSFFANCNRRGFHTHLTQEGAEPRDKRRVSMIVQCDGGEVRVEGLVCKYRRQTFGAVLGVFDQFQV